MALFFMSDSPIYTDSPIIAKASGEQITEADQQVIDQFSNLAPETFISIYGADRYNSLLQESEAVEQASADILLANSKSGVEQAADLTKNIITGALTGITSAGSFVTTPIHPVSEGLARTTQAINEFSQSIGSDSEKAARRLYEFKDKGLKSRLDREEKEGKTSKLERIWEEYGKAAVNAFESGYAAEVAGSGLGSMATGGPIGKAVLGGLKLAGKAAPTLSAGINAVTKGHPEKAGWAIGMGLEEGGGTYGDMLIKGLDMETEELMLNSPEFKVLYEEYLAETKDPARAAKLAKEDLAYAAAREAGLLTAAGAGVANYFTAGLGKGIEKAGVLRSMLTPFTKKADDSLDKFIAQGFSEPAEETITEGWGQFASNLATKDYLNKNQDLSEDIGSSAAEGLVGGLGFTGVRTAGQAVPIAGKVLEASGRGLEAAAEAKHAWEISEKRTNAFIKDIQAKETEFESNANIEKGSLESINAKLNTLAEEVFNKESPVNLERQLEILDEISSIEDEYNKAIGSDISFENKKSEKIHSKYISRLNTVLNNIRENIVNPYQKETKGGDPEKNAEPFAKYLVALSEGNAKNLSEAKTYFNSLAPENKQAISAFKFNNPVLDSKLQQITGSSSTINSSPVNVSTVSDQVNLTENTSDTVNNTVDVSASDVKENKETTSKDSTNNTQSSFVEKTEATSIPNVEDIIDGRGRDTWKDSSVNEVKVGGKDRGSKYEEGILTRPGTAPNKWNGQKLEDIKDPEGGKALGKFYSSNGSEYVYTDKGYTRRVKFNDPKTNGSDAGVNNWKKVFFLKKDSDLHKDWASGPAMLNALEKFQNRKIDSDGTVLVQESSGAWRPLKRSDILTKSITPGSAQDTVVKFDMNAKPSKDMALVEFSNMGADNTFKADSFHTSGGIGYVENSQEDSKKPKNKSTTTESFRVVKDISSLSDIHITEQLGNNLKLNIHSTDNTVSLSQDGVTYVIPESYADRIITAFNEDNPEEYLKAIQDTVKALNNTYKNNPESIQRYSEDLEKLSPGKLEEKSLYRNDEGEIEEYDSKAVNESFVSKIKGSITSILKVVKRPFHVWNTDKGVVNNFLDLIKDPESFEKHLLANHFTNREALVKALFTVDGKISSENTNPTDFDPSDSVANQIRGMIGEGTVFRKDFEDVIYPKLLERNGKEPKAFLYQFEHSDAFKETLLLATVHFLASMRAFPSEFNEAWMQKYGIDAEIQDPDFLEKTAEGVTADFAQQNFATAIRKFFGVNIKNDIPQEQLNEFLATVTGKVIAGLVATDNIEIVQLEVKDREYSTEAKAYVTTTRKIPQIKVHPDYNRLFGATADILTRIVDANHKNVVHLTAPKAKTTVAHTATKISKTAEQVIQKQNDVPHEFTHVVNALVALGGEEGYNELVTGVLDATSRKLSNVKDFVSKKGQVITRRQAFNYLKESFLANPNIKATYYSHKEIKTGRFMQEGAATFQNNKLLRACQTVGKATVNLLKKDLKDVWTLTLAQNLGASVNKQIFETLADGDNPLPSEAKEALQKTEATLNIIKQGLKNLKYRDSLLKLIQANRADIVKVKPEDGKEIRQKIAEFITESNKNKDIFELSLANTGLSAFVEMIRYAKAEEDGTLSQYTPEILCEIDGINDGPAYINAVCSRVTSAYVEEQIKNGAKTGFYVGVSTTPQEIAQPNSKAAKLFGITQPDFHAEVAKIAVTQYFLSRVAAFNNNESIGNKSAGKRAFKNILVLFKAIGWLEGDIDKALSLTSVPSAKDFPITFARDISKKLVTIIPYGSRPRGSMEQLSSFLFSGMYGKDGVYAKISKAIKKVYKDSEATLGDIETIREFQDIVENGSYVVIDTETTSSKNGPDVNKEEIAQISVIKVDKNGKELSSKTWFLNVTRDIPEKINGKPNPLPKVYAEATKQIPSEALSEVEQFIGNLPLAGHNIAGYDIPILERQLGKKLNNKVIDTYHLSKLIQPEKNSHKQDYLVKPEESTKAHLADVDTLNNVKLILELRNKAPEAKKRIHSTLSDLNRASDDTDLFNGYSYRQVAHAIEELFSIQYSKGTFTDQYGSIDKYVRSFTKELPTRAELEEKWIAAKNGMLYKPGKDTSNVSARNMFITAEGLLHLTNLLIPVIGEPAQAAVVDVIGSEGIRASSYLSATAGILTFLAQGVIKNTIAKAGNLEKLNANELYELDNKINKIGAVFHLPSGTLAIVKKELFKTSDKALYTDPETGLSYRSSLAELDSASVAGSPSIVQAMGDASMISYYVKNQDNLLTTQVYDGVYSSIKDQKDTQTEVNKATFKAQNQKVFGMLQKRLEQVGKALISLGYAKQNKDPNAAIVECLINMATNKQINGTPISNVNVGKNTLPAELARYIETLNEINSFESDLQKQEESNNIRRNNRSGLPNKTRPASVEQLIKDKMKVFFDMGKEYVLTEEFKHQVSKKIPMTVQHMSAGVTNYQVGNTLTVDQAYDLLNSINDKLKQENLGPVTWPELMAIYQNIKLKDLIENSDKLSSEDKKLLNKSLKFNEGRDVKSYLPQSVVVAIDLAFATEDDSLKNRRASSTKYQTYTNKAAIKALASIRDKVNNPAVFTAIFNKVINLLPKDTKVIIVSDVDNLPKNPDSKNKGLSGNQKGVCKITKEGTTIYIVDQSGSLDLMHPKNVEVLAHESIHAVISMLIHEYYNNPKSDKLTEIQRSAIKNLENLLDDFLDSTMWEDDGNLPSVVLGLRKLLSDKNLSKAARLDESLAYIFTNEELISYLGSAKLREDRLNLHHKNWQQLLNKILFSAKKLWFKLLKIVAGSRLSDIIIHKTEQSVEYQKDFHTFIELYGNNTLGILNEETNPNKKQFLTREDARKTINSDIYRPMFGIEERRINSLFKTGRLVKPFKSLKDAFEKRVRLNQAFNLKPFELASSKGNAKVKENLIKSYEQLNAYKAGLFDIVKDILPDPDKIVEFFSDIQHQDSISPEFRTVLTRAYLLLKDNITPEFFVDDWNTASDKDKENAFELYKIFAGEHPFFTDLDVPKIPGLDPKFKEQAFFFALVTHYPGFNEKLGKVKFKENSKYKDAHTPAEVFEILSENLTKTWEKKNLGQEASAQDILDIAIADQEDYRNPESTKNVRSLDAFFGKVDSLLVQTLLLPFGLIPFGIGKKAKAIRENYKNQPSLPLDLYFWGMETLRKLSNKNTPTWAVDFIKDFYGKLPSNSKIENLLKEIKGYLDKVRHLLLDSIPENLEKAFKNTKVNFELKNFLAINFGSIDVSSFTFDEIKDFLVDPLKVDQKIQEIKNLLERDYSENSLIYDAKAKQLAKYIMGTEEAGNLLYTNAYAIARLPGLKNVQSNSFNQIEHLLNRLITLYCIKEQNQETKDQFKKLFAQDLAAMQELYNQIVEAYSIEKERLTNSEDESYKYNHLHGWVSSGDRVGGHVMIASKHDYETTYKSQGYRFVEDYKASNIDKSEPMVIIYCAYPHQKEYQEGILQSINKTGFGYQFLKGTRDEITGSRILDSEVALAIYENLNKESSGHNVIPIWDTNGLPKGFERSVPPHIRTKYVNANKDLFRGIAQFRARQERESVVDSLTLKAVDLAWEDYSNASDNEKNSEFINVVYEPRYKDAFERLPLNVKKHIKNQFGDNFYLRKDVIDSFLGYERRSLTDMWDRKFILPAKVEEHITKWLDALLKAVGLEGRYATGLMESFLKGAVSWTRDTIIVRSLIIPAFNAIANFLVLYASLGIPLPELLKLCKENIIYTHRYNSLYKQQLKLEYRKANTSPEERAKLEKKIKEIRLEYESFPIYRMLKEGEYSSISIEGTKVEEIEIFKQKPEETINAFISKYSGSEKAKNIAKNLLLTKDSVSYQTLAEFVNMSDWIAKTVAYRYLTEGSKKYAKPIVGHDDARNIASILFVDFDQFVGRDRDFTNRLGLTWFMTYKYRMVPAAILSLMLNPSRMILGTLLDSLLGFGLGTPATENLFSKLATGNIANSVGLDMIIRGLFLHPLATLFKFLGA